MDRTLVPSGYAYLGHVLRSIDDLSFDAYDALERDDEAQRTRAKAAGGAPWEDDLGVGDEPESAVLLSLDPKEWKVGAVLSGVY